MRNEEKLAIALLVVTLLGAGLVLYTQKQTEKIERTVLKNTPSEVSGLEREKTYNPLPATGKLEDLEESLEREINSENNLFLEGDLELKQESKEEPLNVEAVIEQIQF